jgi:hypothetical protein
MPVAKAGFLDFLFAAPAPQPVATGVAKPLPASPQEATREVAQPTKTRTASAKPVNSALCCKNGEDPRAAIMADPTLRPGDAVVTRNGILIFRGTAGATQHNRTDFVPLAQAEQVPSDRRAQLQVLDKNNKRIERLELAQR